MNSKDLAWFRVECGLTQGQMADLLSIDRVTLWRWETGRYPIDDGYEKILLSKELPDIIDVYISGLTEKEKRAMRRRINKRLAGGGN